MAGAVFLGSALPWLEAIIVIPVDILADLPPVLVLLVAVIGNPRISYPPLHTVSYQPHEKSGTTPRGGEAPAPRWPGGEASLVLVITMSTAPEMVPFTKLVAATHHRSVLSDRKLQFILSSVKELLSRLGVMLISERTEPSQELSTRSVTAVQVDDVADETAARELIDGVVTAANLINLPEVHVWADAEALPRLAVAAAGIREIPEGFQLRQLGTTLTEDEESDTVWLAYESLMRLARSRKAAVPALAA